MLSPVPVLGEATQGDVLELSPSGSWTAAYAAPLESLSDAPAIPKTIYDLRIPRDFASPKKPLSEQLVMPTPTAILLLTTLRFLLVPNKELAGFADAQWAD